VAIWDASIPEISNRGARENAGERAAETVRDDSDESDPAGQACLSIDEETKELA
jgi:hypothetical protein